VLTAIGHEAELRIAFRQFVKGAFGFNRPLLQQHDLVAVLYGAEAMRDEDDGFLVRQGVDGVHHGLFSHGVERAGGFVKHQHFGVVIQRSSDADALALAAREAYAALAHERFVLRRQVVHDEVVHLRHARAALHLCLIDLCLGDAERDIFNNAGVG
jgi:hypothetical protein